MIGETLGPYLLLDELGKGGMGEVYRAEDEGGRAVAVKILGLHLSRDEAARRRFEREVRLLSELDHPHLIASRSAVAVERGRAYYAMELVDGEDLSAALSSRRIWSFEAIANLIDELLDGLGCAHEAGILHRDIKPSNIFITAAGRAKLGDFGLARAAHVTRLTRSGTVMGTPEYMSPEQAEGREIDARSDLYAVGVVLYELLSGRPPFLADHPLAVLRKQVDEAPPPLPEMVPEAFAPVVARALAKDPEARWPDAAAFRDALSEATRALAAAQRRETVVLGQMLAAPRSGRDSARAALAEAPTRSLSPEKPESAAPEMLRRRLGPRIALALAVGALLASAIFASGVWTAADREEALAGFDLAGPNPVILVEFRSGRFEERRLVAIDVEQELLRSREMPPSELLREERLAEIRAFEKIALRDGAPVAVSAGSTLAEAAAAIANASGVELRVPESMGARLVGRSLSAGHWRRALELLSRALALRVRWTGPESITLIEDR